MQNKRRSIHNFVYIPLSIVLVFLVVNVSAQELPRPSPKASVTQFVGLTEVAIHYSSPGVKDREIWGSLVPYNKIWRAGANEATTISFSDEVTIEGNKVPAGKYALFTLPTKSEWTIIFSKKHKQWGTFTYDEKDDLLRIKVKPEKSSEFKERMAYYIEPIRKDTAIVTLHWERLKVSFSLQVDVVEKAMQNIRNALETSDEKWRVLFRGAEYCLGNNVHLDQGMEWINESIALKEYYYNNWIKAQLLAQQQQYEEALKFAQKARDLGEAEKNRFYLSTSKPDIEKSIAEWKKKK
jgi:tetratricopeptide (TPR) repeat protein